MNVVDKEPKKPHASKFMKGIFVSQYRGTLKSCANKIFCQLVLRWYTLSILLIHEFLNLNVYFRHDDSLHDQVCQSAIQDNVPYA